MKNFDAMQELKNAMDTLAKTLKENISEISADIDENKQVINDAYHNIVEDKNALDELDIIIEEFVDSLERSAEDTDDNLGVATEICEDCRTLAEDGYIEDYEDDDFEDEDEDFYDEDEDDFEEDEDTDEDEDAE